MAQGHAAAGGLPETIGSNLISNSYRQILKSSALIGGSSVVNVLLGLVRTKFTAIYLGTLGVGLMGTYSSITGMMGTLAGLGIGSSGVRQIAEASVTGDQLRIARTVLTIRRAAMVLGLVGTLLLILVARPVCQWTFGDTSQTLPVMVISVTVLFTAVSNGQTALVQGVRRISDLARLSVLGALLGTVIAIPMMIQWGQKSVVPILLAGSGTAILTSWYFARKVTIAKVTMTWRETWHESKPLLKLGLVFASSGLMTSGVAYLTRVIIIRRLGLDAAGLYGAAWTLSSFYVGFILGAMGADFYPRLTAVAQDHSQVNRLVNEQTEVSLLLTLPGLVATLTFAPWVIHLLYSSAFVPAGEVLRWQVLGLALRVLAWPMGFIMLAKGNAKLFFWCELISNLVHLGLIWGGVACWGLPGTGVAFMGLYIFSTLLMIFVTRRLTSFQWTPANSRLIILTTVVSVGTLLSALLLPQTWSLAVGSSLAAATGVYSLKALTRLTGSNPLTTAFLKLKAAF